MSEAAAVLERPLPDTQPDMRDVALDRRDSVRLHILVCLLGAGKAGGLISDFWERKTVDGESVGRFEVCSALGMLIRGGLVKFNGAARVVLTPEGLRALLESADEDRDE